MRDFSVFTMKTKTRPWRHKYHDIEIPRPKSHDIEVPRPKNHNVEILGLKYYGIEKRSQLSHDIVIPRHFFQKIKSHDIGIPRLKNHDIEIPRPKNHGIKLLWNSDLYAPLMNNWLVRCWTYSSEMPEKWYVYF